MVVLGVIRVRAAHSRHGNEENQDAEMAWDDSPLNITVNPMDVSFYHSRDFEERRVYYNRENVSTYICFYFLTYKEMEQN